MAFKKTTRASALGTTIIVDNPVTSKIAQAHVTGAAATLYAVMIDCTENTDASVYVKLKDATSIATVSTCQPDTQFFCPAGETMQYTIPGGLTYAAGISYYVTTDAGVGGTIGTTGRVKLYLTVT